MHAYVWTFNLTSDNAEYWWQGAERWDWGRVIPQNPECMFGGPWDACWMEEQGFPNQELRKRSHLVALLSAMSRWGERGDLGRVVSVSLIPVASRGGGLCGKQGCWRESWWRGWANTFQRELKSANRLAYLDDWQGTWLQCVNIFVGNTLVTNRPFTALEKIAGSFYVFTMKSDKIHLEPRPVFCKGDKLLKQPAEGWLFSPHRPQESSREVSLNKRGMGGGLS